MSLKLKPLEQQVMVITGASSGIGLATAEAAYMKGAKLVLVGRSEITLMQLAELINADGGEAIAVGCDVSDRIGMQKVALAAVTRYGRIDTWVNNAGVSIFGRLDVVSEEDSRRLFDVNFWGVVNGSLAALPYLLQSNGALINVGSEVSEAVVPIQGMYSASKHAVKGFTDALRIEIEEVDKKEISITLIQPTAVDTPFPSHARNYQSKEAMLPSPLIDPTQVAEAILSAAVSPVRSVKVGMMATINTTIAKFIPSMGAKLAAKQADRQHSEENTKNPNGALYVSSESMNVVGTTNGVPRTV